MIHKIKVDPIYYESLLNGSKLFELRYNDRNYKVDDHLIIYEFENGQTLGRALRFKVTFVLSNYCGLLDGYVILSLQRYPILLMDLPKLSDQPKI